MSIRRILLTPLALVYGAVLLIRHALYDRGLWKSRITPVPSIGVGNLALGGTGKTPHVELVLRALEGIAPVATLSRGYGRSGTAIREVRTGDLASDVGDEPLQLKQGFSKVHVFVGADRGAALHHMVKQVPGLRVAVLDDAFQHRRVVINLHILLTTWQRPWCDDALLPAGSLRDLPSRSKAAHIVVVTKCPSLPSDVEQKRWRARLGLREEQELFFSGIDYGDMSEVGHPSSMQSPATRDGSPGPRHTQNLLLVTGIADPAPLVDHLHQRSGTLVHVAFPDHHRFTAADLRMLAKRYANFAAGPKMLVTTVKDATRLLPLVKGSPLEGLPLAVIPMKAVILNEPERFAKLIRHHVGPHQAHR